jgi:L-type amino acid transporter 5
MFANWVWYGLAVSGLIYWRFTRLDIERPFKINLVIPIFFVTLCAGLLIFSFLQQPKECGIGLIISLIGVPVYYLFIKYQDQHPQKFKKFMREYHCLCADLG